MSMSLDRRRAVSFDLSRLAMAIVAVAVAVCGCSSESGNNERSMVVSVSAYNSVPSQTNSEPTVTAWGDKLKPGMKAVAISPDLLNEGLSHGSKVKIEGLKGTYVVLDKTNARFTKRVDVYMGVDVEAAKEFGVQQLRVTWSE
jgi:3D (Asp-Asp-Asp) domain-containing protein